MPHPFKTLAEANEAYAAIHAENEIAVAARDAAQLQAQTNFSNLTAATTERDEARASVATLTTANATLTTANATLTTQAETHAAALAKSKEVTTEAVNAKAIEILAASGHRALRLTTSENEHDGKTMTRSDFDALSATARAAFIRGRGRISD